MAPDAPVLREDLEGKTERRAWQAPAPQPHLHLGGRRRGRHGEALAAAPVTAKELIVYQRVHPCPLETCGCVASMDKINGHLTVWGTFQAPHAVRTRGLADLRHPRAQDPHHLARYRRRLRQQGRRLSGLCHARSSPRSCSACRSKWIEDRIENLAGDRVRPRLPHDRRACRDQGRQDHRRFGATCWPITARSMPAPIPPNIPPASSASAPAPTTSRSRMS